MRRRELDNKEDRRERVMIGKPLKVMIVGAGIGGLCLAQGLKLDNISVAVFGSVRPLFSAV